MTNEIKRSRSDPVDSKSGILNGLYSKYRTLGLVCNDVPLAYHSRGGKHYVTSSVGRAFQIFDLSDLSLLLVSSQIQSEITAIAACDDLTFVAAGASVTLFKRAKPYHSFDVLPEKSISIYSLLVLGSWLVGCDRSGYFFVLDYKTKEFITPPVQVDVDSGTWTTCVHPNTYMNKILVGTSSGYLLLINIHTQKLIHKFAPFESSISCISVAPVVDVVAIGLSNGQIILYHLKHAKCLYEFSQDSCVTSIAFRTDDVPHFATADVLGTITVFDLESRKVLFEKQSAHFGRIGSLMFAGLESVLISSGADNSVKEWTLDGSFSALTLLKSRSGHTSSPIRIRYQLEGDENIVSCARNNSVRLVSLVKDSQSRDYFRKDVSGHQILADMALPKQVFLDWPCIVTFDRESTFAHSWSLSHKQDKMLEFSLSDKSTISSVAVTFCGNYVAFGSKSGLVEIYNLQSGLIRRKLQGHSKAVTSICFDLTGLVLLTASLDCTINVWNVTNGKVHDTVQFDSPVTQMLSHVENNLVALADDDFCVSILDLDTRVIVRRFQGHTGKIQDMSFTSDAKWLATASVDGYVKTWDVVTGRLLDTLLCEHVPSSLTFTAGDKYLAIADVFSFGIQLWLNSYLYDPSSCVLSSDSYADISLDTLSVNVQPSQEDVSMSQNPLSKWITLLNIDAIKKRNRPIQPVAKPKAAPFFLFSLPSDSNATDLNTLPSIEDTVKQLVPAIAPGDSDLDHLPSEFLNSHIPGWTFDSLDEKTAQLLLSKLSAFSPSALSAELQLLTVRDVELLLRLLIQYNRGPRLHYDCFISIINYVLKTHDALIMENSRLRSLLPELALCAESSWSLLNEQLQQLTCMLDLIREE